MNQVFGYQTLPIESSLNDMVVSGSKPYTIDNKIGLVKFYVNSGTSFQGYCCEKTGTYAYVWGIPSHPDVKMSNVPQWCLNTFIKNRYDRFKELIGTFVIFIDEPKQRRITVITDILGIRPMFFKLKNGKVILGSNVWDLYKSGMSTGNVDYDAVSSWVAFGVNFTDGTLFSDFSRLSPGSVISFQNGRKTDISYATFESNTKIIPVEQVSREIHEIVALSTKTLLEDHPKISIALSGGYDSRYLLALSSALTSVTVKCASVGFNEGEKIIAEKVSQVLNFPLECYPINGSVWDLYDEVYHRMGDGFLISKFVPYLIALRNPSVPMLNGFMGDALIRGDSDKYKGKYESEWKEDLVDVLHQKHSKVRYEVFRKKIARNLKMRSRVPMEKAVREGLKLGKIFGWQDYYYTHRFYISNNFLQHLDIAEALIPFYNWNLLSYKMRHAYDLFNWNTYYCIMQSYYPDLYKIPHSNEFVLKKKIFETSKCTKRWAQDLLSKMGSKKTLLLLNKKICLPLNFLSMAKIKKLEHTIFVFQRFYLFEKMVKENGLNFDWDNI